MFKIKRKQLLQKDIKTIWNFISNPYNLEKITPKDMSFEIISKNLEKEIYPEMIIKYKVAPFLKIKMKWVTKITEVQSEKKFIDKQIKGPYSFWEHEHILEKHEKGTMMYDVIKYKPPLGLIGSLCNFLFIKNKLNGIFNFRENFLEEKFNK
tara:strand:- start:560 stop:1015 length:456 start_codon:yes stop_codon:yes gene_type:complete